MRVTDILDVYLVEKYGADEVDEVLRILQDEDPMFEYEHTTLESIHKAIEDYFEKKDLLDE